MLDRSKMADMRRSRPKITPEQAKQMLEEYEAFKAAGGLTTPTGGAHFMQGCNPADPVVPKMNRLVTDLCRK